MKRSCICLTALAALTLSASVAAAQPAPGLERLYILNCGEGRAGDISRWSPGVNVGKSMDFVDNCYLIKHRQGWLLWDTGVTAIPQTLPAHTDTTTTDTRPASTAHTIIRASVCTRDGTCTG